MADEIQPQSLDLLANLPHTDPNSPYFKEAMTNKFLEELQEDIKQGKIEEFIATAMKNEEAEKKEIVEEQLLLAKQARDEYLEAYAAAEKEKHARTLEALAETKEPPDVVKHLEAENVKLDQEIADLKEKLEVVEQTQEENARKWETSEEKAVAKMVEKAGPNVQIECADGTKIELNQEEVKEVFNASKGPPPGQIAKVVGLVAVTDEEVAAQADEMARRKALMGQFRVAFKLKEKAEEKGKPFSMSDACQNENNKNVVNAADLSKGRDKDPEAKAIATEQNELCKKAFTDTTSYLVAKIEVAQDKIEQNGNAINYANKPHGPRPE